MGKGTQLRWLTVLLSVLALAVLPGWLPCAAAWAETDTVTEADPETDTVTEASPAPELYQPELPEDDLFASYVEQQFLSAPAAAEAPAESGIRKLLKKASSRLGGINVLLCQLLKEKVSAVAAGGESETAFFLSVAELGLTDLSWTAEELGVDAIVVDGKITSEAMQAASGKIGIKLKTLIDTLLADCPYELYWYDKTVGVQMSGPRYSAASTGGVWRLRPVNGYTFSFAVPADYAAGEYLVDTSTGERVAVAAANARSIVEENAALADLEKLQAYRIAICERTAYNYTAANTSPYPYGDPWQLIWVFDDDPNTKVVCEGYAKAFQYLFDMSTFAGTALECRMVTGQMDSGSGGRNHMWNVVTLDDGLNYMADVTNCDAGNSGFPDKLFLVRPNEENTQDSFLAGYTWVLPTRTMSYVYSDRSAAIYETADLVLTAWEMEAYVLADGADVFAAADTVLPDGLQVLEEEAFAGSPVQTVKCPENLTEIGSRAFADCGSLRHIWIPADTASIAEDAFDGCGHLVIWGPAGSAAETFAETHRLLFRSL